MIYNNNDIQLSIFNPDNDSKKKNQHCIETLGIGAFRIVQFHIWMNAAVNLTNAAMLSVPVSAVKQDSTRLLRERKPPPRRLTSTKNDSVFPSGFPFNPDSDPDVCRIALKNVVDSLSRRRQSFHRVSWKLAGDYETW